MTRVLRCGWLFGGLMLVRLRHRTTDRAQRGQSGKLLIPLERRDVRVVEGARLEIDSARSC